MQLSIIIINFNTFQLTVDCISSVLRHIKSIELEIILVDNFPKEDYKDHFLQLFPFLRYHRSEENIGFGRANNLGMSMAKGDYFLLLNSDTVIVDDSILECIRFMHRKESSSIGLLGCKLLNADGSYQPSFYPYTKHFFWNYCIANNILLHKLFNVSSAFQPTDEVREVGDVSGAFMLLRRSVFEKTGGFDPDFFLYYEETDWCRNRIHKDYKIVYYPKASIIHLGGQSAPKAAMQIQASISQALYWYKKGWPSFIGFIFFSLFNTAFYLLQYPFTPATGKQNIRFGLKSLQLAIPYWLFNIPKWKRKYGARPEPLIYNGARSIFFKRNNL